MKVEAMSCKPRSIARLAFILTLSLAGCTNQSLPELTINSASIYTAQDANQNSATAIDLVIIYDQNLANSIGKMSASQYFSNARQLLLDNPTLLDVWHWELVPGQIVQAFTPEPGQTEAYAAYVFANYLTPGDHRLKVAPNGIVSVLLQKNDLLDLSTESLVAANPDTIMSYAIKTTQFDPLCPHEPHINFRTTNDTRYTRSSLSSPCCESTATEPTLPKTEITPPAYKTPCGSMITPPTHKIPCDSAAAPSSSHSISNSEYTAQQILKHPIPIATRPLQIPPALRKNTPGLKVKNG
ncbi:MAG: hypothetical protein K2X02_02430 [Alphaproteobacteria bacterium]|nr:hypothetical protein [Alphaproteobacteria bacterium]